MEQRQDVTSTAGGASGLTDVLERMRARADNAYCDYISQLRRDECLGWEIKAERGKFGDAELKAHCAAAEKLGRHRALHEAAKMLEEAHEQIAEAIRADEREHPGFTPEMVEAIYAAWHGAGVDISGGDWRRFVGMLPMRSNAEVTGASPALMAKRPR